MAQFLALLLASCLGFALSESQFQVRLKNGDSSCSGRVEVYMDGSWGNICDDDWDLADANVVCRQLGCGPARAAYSSAKYGPGLESDPIFMKNVECSGTENSLGQCQYEEDSFNLCDHTEDAGVGCEGTFTKKLAGEKKQRTKRKEKERKKNRKDKKKRKKEKRKKKESLDIRLVNGPNGCRGRLEVNYNGQWGTVCDDQWDVLDAKVACKQLGCGRPVDANKCDLFGAGSGPIWLDEVKCTGKEETLAKCMANKKGVHNCTHQEDVGLVCLEPMKLRLVDGPEACSGRLEVYYKGEWGTVCNDQWDLKDADVVCRELACGNAQQHEIVRLRYGKASGRIWLDDVDCEGNEKSLEHCKHRIWGYNDCTHTEDVSVICSGSSAP